MTRVSSRVDPSYFSVDRQPSRWPVAALGDQARAAVATREQISILRLQLLPRDPAGDTGRVNVSLPDSAVGLPDGAFVLRTMQSDADGEPAATVAEVIGGDWTRAEGGWRLIRDPEASHSAVLEVAVPSTEGRTFVALDAFGPTPQIPESHAFELPRGARFEFGYGLTDPENASPGATSTFTATLRCGDTPSAVVLTETLRADDPAAAGWHDATVLPGNLHGRCRLRLEVTGQWPELGGPVWAVPRIVTPVRRSHSFDARSLVLISLDTLRADHVSGYGYSRETSPAIDRLLIARGATFTDASTTYPMTHIAHMSAFTGLYPAILGSGRHGGPDLLPRDAAVSTLPEALRGAGFETAAFTEGGLLAGNLGFWFGFDEFTERTSIGVARDTFADGIRYLREHADRKFFLFLHTYQTHAPYQPSAEYQGLFQQDDGRLVARPGLSAKHLTNFDNYDREIRETDDLLAGFLTALDDLELSHRTYVVLLSDHGEAFGEHGLFYHGWGPHQEQLRVPWVVRGPGVPAGLRITAPVSLVDLAPTLLEMLDVRPLEQAQGVSLNSALRGGEPPSGRPIYFGWLGRGERRGVRDGRFKVVSRVDKATGERQPIAVYDLAEDPAEKEPLAGLHPYTDRGQRLLEAHEVESTRRAESLGVTDAAPSSPWRRQQLTDQLRALGYLE